MIQGHLPTVDAVAEEARSLSRKQADAAVEDSCSHITSLKKEGIMLYKEYLRKMLTGYPLTVNDIQKLMDIIIYIDMKGNIDSKLRVYNKLINTYVK